MKHFENFDLDSSLTFLDKIKDLSTSHKYEAVKGKRYKAIHNKSVKIKK